MTASASPPGSLAVRLRRANSTQLMELVDHHGRELQLRHVRQILLNPFCDRPVIEALMSMRSLISIYVVRAALCRHPKTPQADAMRHVAGLFWRDLMEISLDLRLAPAVRRVAERTLLQRLPRLTVGEKISLARRAAPDVAVRLTELPDLRILAAVLDNPRLTASALLPLANDAQASPRKLALLAEHPRWGRPYEIRAALGRNPQAPFRVHLAILPDLRLEDLRDIAALKEHASIIRHRAAELVQSHLPKKMSRDDVPAIDG